MHLASRRGRCITRSLLAAIALALPAGCPDSAATGVREIRSDIDIEGLVELGIVSLDVTLVNNRLMSRAEFESIHATGRVRVEWIDHPMTGARCALLVDGGRGEAALVLGGTTSTIADDYNARTTLVPYASGRVHEGYWSLAVAIAEALDERVDPALDLSIAGFSQGGAVAALLPLTPQASARRIRRIVTLGQPRVVDAALADRLRASPLYRLVAAGDPIPAWPPSLEYAHFGRCIILLNGPYVLVREQGESGYDQGLAEAAARMRAIDHATYRLRLASKREPPVYVITGSD